MTWSDSPQSLYLTDAVDLWLIPFQPATPDLLATLAPAERERSKRMRPDIADRFLFAQAALRDVLGRYTGGANLGYRFGPHGKPYLADFPEVQFNLSHSGEWALVGVSKDAEIGVDLEEIRPTRNPAAIAAKFFSAAQQQRLQAADPAEIDATFAQLWTEFESLGKAWGVGVSRTLVADGIEIRPVEMPPGYRASLARFGEIGELRQFKWTR